MSQKLHHRWHCPSFQVESLAAGAGLQHAPFWCVCQKLSLSPLYFNKTSLHKSSEWTSLVSGPGLNSSPEAKNPASLRGSVTTCHLGGSSGILQDKVRMLGALYSPSKYVFWCTLLTLWCSCMDEWNALCGASEEPCSAVPQWPHTPYSRNLLGVYTDLPMPRNTQCLLWWPIRNGQSMWTELSQSNILVPLTIS